MCGYTSPRRHHVVTPPPRRHHIAHIPWNPVSLPLCVVPLILICSLLCLCTCECIIKEIYNVGCMTEFTFYVGGSVLTPAHGVQSTVRSYPLAAGARKRLDVSLLSVMPSSLYISFILTHTSDTASVGALWICSYIISNSVLPIRWDTTPRSHVCITSSVTMAAQTPQTVNRGCTNGNARGSTCFIQWCGSRSWASAHKAIVWEGGGVRRY